MDVTFFSPQIPPSWLASGLTKKLAGTTVNFDNATAVPNFSDAKFSVDGTESVQEFISNLEKNISYSFNAYGYRETEYEEDYFKYDRLILTIGHSCVFGVSVKNEDCWPRLLEQSLPNTRVLNFGILGASMDTIARMTACLVPYFKPLCKNLEVATLWAQGERREIFQDNYATCWNPWKEPPFPEYILTIDAVSNRYNHQKNEAMLRAVCGQYNVPLHVVPWRIYEQATAAGKPPTADTHKEMLVSLLEQIK